MSKTSNILNLIIIMLTIYIVHLVKLGYEDFEDPYGMYQSNSGPMVYNGPMMPPVQLYPPVQTILPNQAYKGPPLIHNTQVYPAIPYYPNIGQTCKSEMGCGVIGQCQDGICQSVDNNGTAFNIQV
jgi:hypothetical protein